MLDLNSLQIFVKVASLRSFTAAARSLGLPKSNVSRSVASLERSLGVRLFQRTTREVVLTPSGTALLNRSHELVAELAETVQYISALKGKPAGLLRISAGIGFGIKVLADQLPEFVRRYPKIDIALDLESRNADLVADSIDVAIRLGALPASGLVAVKLGEMRRYLCAASEYLERNGSPVSIGHLADHDLIEMPGANGRSRAWTFSRGQETLTVDVVPRISVNEALTIHGLVLKGAGLGILSGYVCGPDIDAGRLIRLFSDWSLPSVEVHLLFPSRRELAPTVRAFVDYMKEVSHAGANWMNDPYPP